MVKNSVKNHQLFLKAETFTGRTVHYNRLVRWAKFVTIDSPGSS
jgi:hypothetical protein